MITFERINPDVKLPKFATEGSVGMDLFSPKDVVLIPGKIERIPLGIKCKFNKHRWAMLRPKSGHASKQGIHVLAGILDEDYRGEVCALMISFGTEPYLIKKDEKLLQMIEMEVVKSEIVEGTVDEDTERGTGGFGSTGK